MEKFKKILPTIIFNIAETGVIVLIGMLLDVPITYIILIIVTFLVTRGLLGKTIHFKTWYRCMVWSLLLMLSLFELFKVDLVICITFAVFTAYILTGKANINDVYLWKNYDEPSKYQDVIDYVTYNELDDKLLEFERKIKDRNNLEYLIYKYKFKDGKTFTEMSELLDMDNPRIVEQLDKIAFALRLYCGI